MRLHIEWIDKTWKSTLVKYLRVELNLLVVKFSQPKTEDAFSEYIEFFWTVKDNKKETRNDNIICDRSRIWENVYWPVYRKKWLKKFQIKKLDESCKANWDLIIRCSTDKWMIKKKFKEDNETFAQLKDVWRLERYFRKTLKWLKTTVIEYDRQLWNMESIKDIILALKK